MTNTMVRARIDEHVKADSSTVLASIGVTVSDAFRLMSHRPREGAAFRAPRPKCRNSR